MPEMLALPWRLGWKSAVFSLIPALIHKSVGLSCPGEMGTQGCSYLGGRGEEMAELSPEQAAVPAPCVSPGCAPTLAPVTVSPTVTISGTKPWRLLLSPWYFPVWPGQL